MDGKAAVDRELCSECEACIAACPQGAISFAPREEDPAVEPAPVPARRPEPDVIAVRTGTPPVPLRARVLPVIGASLAWLGREIVPRLADYLLDSLDRRVVQRPASDVVQRTRNEDSQRGRRGGGRRRHRRRRGA